MSRSSGTDWQRHYHDLSSPHSPGGIGRRNFLQGALATGALGLTGLHMFGSAQSASALGPDERILVVVLFGGGNDGISMVVPADDGRYIDARKDLAISPAEALPLNDNLYWNPNLAGISERYAAGQVAVVQGIGDPADDRSHFSSMARWMRGAADPMPSFGLTGWLGRWLDAAGAGELAGIAVGDSGIPLHMRGTTSQITSLSSYGNLYGADVEPWEIPAIDASLAIAANGPGGFWPTEVASKMAEAIGTASTVSPIYSDTLPEEGIERDLALAAETINLDIGARVLTVAFGDFDTHDGHMYRYQDLMLAFDQAVTGFFNRLNPAFADRVVLMTFSEFGRSWTANDSAGVDHGTASNALVIGSPVAGGLYGQQPDLSRFDAEGDLESTVDFRSYYATILDGWLQADSQQILGATFEDLGIFTSGPGDPVTAGDVNCDDAVNLADALFIAQYAVGSRTNAGGCPLTDAASQIHVSAGDVNEDGQTTTEDADLILQCLAGNEVDFCPEG